jgi:sulfide:quinone oxidoreductase
MKRAIILGAGFGGLAAAYTLRKLLHADDEVILVDRRPYFMVGFRKTWALLGESPLADGQGSLAEVEKHGIQFLQGKIDSIDPLNRAVNVAGRRIEADAMVVALGARLAGEEIPGFQEHAYNVYDPQDIPRAASALQNFKGGKIVVGIFGTPYICPPAPYEIAILAQETFEKRGVDASFEIFTPKPMSLPILGAAGCDVIESRLADRGINFLPNHKAKGVEAGQITFTTGRISYDLLLGIPPHRSPEIVKESGLTNSDEWVPVDPRTLETQFENVYAIGDVVEIPMANGKPLPKAGVFAEAEGKIAARRIAANFKGEQPQAEFDGHGGCFLEIGGGQAMMVQGEFLAEPAPKVSLDGPSAKYLEDKRAFEGQRLAEWTSGPA